MPQISIIIAVLNGALTIKKSIQSAQAQTIRDIEIIVADDGSTDGTYDLVSAFAAEDPRIKLISLPKNLGVGGARNAALAEAKGDWITILDADDWYEPNRLEILIKAAQDYNVDLVADNLQIYDHVLGKVVTETHHGRRDRVVTLTAKDFFDGDNPLKRHPMGFIQPLIRRSFTVEHKIAYDQSHRVGEDFIFVAEILLEGAKAVIVPGAYYVYVHRISPTTRKISPYSHSEVVSVFGLMARGCGELLHKYEGRMDEAARNALIRRRWILERATLYQQMRDAVRHGEFISALRLTMTQPVILVLIGNIIMGLLAANMEALLHRKRAARAS